MPIILDLENENVRDIHFLLKEGFLPIDGLEILKQRMSNHIKFNDDWTREELIKLAEDTLTEYDCTLIPFTLFKIRY